MNDRAKNLLSSRLLIGLALIVFGISCKGDVIKNAWGAPTNDARVGIEITSFHMGKDQPPTCILNIQSVSTNGADEIGLRLPKPPGLFNKIELYDPAGQIVRLRQVAQISSFNGVQRAHLRTNQIWQVDYFSVPDNFEIKTNGQYRLVISLTASTNVWGNNPTYFSFPPVTNTFVILSDQIKK